MSEQYTITTSPELIKLLGDKLYDGRLDAILIRELIQNAVDASPKGGEINVVTNWEIRDGGVDFSLGVEDFGIGMDKQVLTEVFLNIGGSYKPSQNGGKESTGGFGIAKVALFNADTWDIHTRNLTMDQDLQLGETFEREGTVVTCYKTFERSMSDYYACKAIRLIYSNNVKGLNHNGSAVEPYKATGRIHHHQTDQGIDYTIRFAKPFQYPWEGNMRKCSGYVIYRINGLVQTMVYSGEDLVNANKNIVVDFGDIGYSPIEKSYPFSMSRESVTGEVAATVNKLLLTLAKDTYSTIKNEGRGTLKVWENERTGLISHSYNGKIYRPSLTDRRIARLWARLVKTMEPDLELQIVVTNEVGTMAFWDGISIGINPQAFLDDCWEIVSQGDSGAFVMAMWHLACHELTHRWYEQHDERFTSEEGKVSRATALRVMDDMDKLRFLARKCWGK